MTAPNLQAEGATATGVTTGVPSITIPTHQADDILVVAVAIWAPNTIGAMADIPTPSGWTLVAGSRVTNGDDGETALFWKRATGAGTTVTLTRGASWDTGTDTMYNGRAYVVRGCITTGDPWDDTSSSGVLTAADGAVPAVTVSGSERMVVQFGISTDNAAFAMTSASYTEGTEDDDTGGTDSAFQTVRLDNRASDGPTESVTVAAPAQGFYSFVGVAFKPPTTNPTGSGGVTIAKPTLSGTGHMAPSGSGGVTIAKPTIAGTGAEAFIGSGGVTIAKPTLSGTGAETFSGSGGVTIAKPTLSGTGAEVFTGSGGVTIAKPTLAGEGTSTGGGPPPVSGSGGVTLPAPAIAGTGAESMSGSGGVTITKPTIAATGAEQFSGSGGVVLAAPSISGSGTSLVPVTGTAGITIPAPVLSGSGTHLQNVTGSGGVTIAAPAIAASGGTYVEGEEETPPPSYTRFGPVDVSQGSGSASARARARQALAENEALAEVARATADSEAVLALIVGMS